MLEQKRRDQAPQAVFPCVLRIIPGAVFNKRDPILVGVDVVEGSLRVGTPICVVKVDAVTNVSARFISYANLIYPILEFIYIIVVCTLLLYLYRYVKYST